MPLLQTSSTPPEVSGLFCWKVPQGEVPPQTIAVFLFYA